MRAGAKFHRGSASAACTYVEADQSRVDDYYLAQGTSLATIRVAGTNTGHVRQQARPSRAYSSRS